MRKRRRMRAVLLLETAAAEKLLRHTWTQSRFPLSTGQCKPTMSIGRRVACSEAAGLARSRAAACQWCCTKLSPHQTTAPNKTDAIAELVCSNRSAPTIATTTRFGPRLHEEMRGRLDGCMRPADGRQPGAGRRRLAVIAVRDGFCAGCDGRGFASHTLVEIARASEIAALAAGRLGTRVIIATGPSLARSPPAIRAMTGEDAQRFFDALPPIVPRTRIDMSLAWFQSRYDNAGRVGHRGRLYQSRSTRAPPPITEEFLDALLAGDRRLVSTNGRPRRPISKAACPIDGDGGRGRSLAVGGR